MNRSRCWLIGIVLILGSNESAPAQHHSHRDHQPSHYAPIAARPIKALSDQQLADLRAGRGMGLALAAELNGYPGPLHVIELADKLGLSDDQKRRTHELHASMRAEAIPLGERLISDEAELNRLFETRSVTPANLATATSAIGTTQASLRSAHLKYHLAIVEVLSKEQVTRYNELRGHGHQGRGN